MTNTNTTELTANVDPAKIQDIADRVKEALAEIEKAHPLAGTDDPLREHFFQIGWLMESLKNEAGLPSDLGAPGEKWTGPY